MINLYYYLYVLINLTSPKKINEIYPFICLLRVWLVGQRPVVSHKSQKTYSLPFDRGGY